MPPLPFVGSRAAHIRHEAEEGIVNGARAGPRRNFHDGRAVLFEVEHDHGVDGVGVGGEEQRVRVGQLVEDKNLVRLDRALSRHA